MRRTPLERVLASLPNYVEGLAAELFGRRGESVRIDFRTGSDAAADAGLRGRCHDNVARWLGANPGDRAVRGWLIDEHRSNCGFVEFHAHSVIVDSMDTLRDITLSHADPEHAFLPDARPDEEFLAIARFHPTLRHVFDDALYGAFIQAVDASILNGGLDNPY